MVDECKNVGLREPFLSSNEYLVTTVFYRNDDDTSLQNKLPDKLQDKLQDKLFELLARYPNIKVKDLVVILKVSTVYYHLKQLMEKGLIVRVGARKNGRWQVNVAREEEKDA